VVVVYTIPRRRHSHLPVAVISLSRRMLTRLEDTGLFEDVAHKYIIHGVNNTQADATPRMDKPPGSSIVVGYLGRMESTKGIEVLLDAAKRLPTRQVGVLLGGSGDEAYVADLQRTYADSNVTFLGFVRPAEFFARIDVLVVPSVWEEPLGRVIYEGYAHGVPAIVSNVGGMQEIVADGHTGFVFNSGDSEQLAAILQRQIDAGWAGGRFFRACTERGRDFSADRVFGDYIKVWEGALRSQPRTTGRVYPASDAPRVRST